MSNTNEVNSTASNKNVGLRLLGFRENLKLSQKQMADFVGVSLSAYQNYERGDRSITKEVICSLISKYNLDANWLLSKVGSRVQTNQEKLTPIDDELILEIESCLRHENSALHKVEKYSAFKAPVIFIYNQVCSITNKEERLNKIAEFVLLYSQASLVNSLAKMEEYINEIAESEQDIQSATEVINSTRKNIKTLESQLHDVRQEKGGD